MTSYVGVVATGRGDLAGWMTMYAELYERVTGVRLFPGSLNLILDRPYRLPAERLRLEPTDYGGRVGMNIVPCSIRGISGFILRTDQNEAGTGHHGHEVIEIAAAVKLRDALNLADGDQVEVTIND
ncbi:MAG: hypothetical protein NVSMB4_14870 [Acidimicrobiales bacterium]